MYNHYKIQAHIGQKIATRVWNAIEDLLWGDGEKVRFKQYGELNSIEGKSNAQTITYREGSVNVFKLKIPIIIRNNDDYANMALQSKIKFCRILRKEIKGKTKSKNIFFNFIKFVYVFLRFLIINKKPPHSRGFFQTNY